MKDVAYENAKEGGSVAGGTSWSGWGFHQGWQWVPGALSPMLVRKYDSTAANALSNEQLRVDTVFNPSPSSVTNSVMPRLVVDAHLAQGIPALTPPTGRIAFGGDSFIDNMINLNDTLKVDRPNGWPARSNYQGRWCHSDMKDVAYFFNFEFYEKVIEKGSLR